MEAIPGFFDNIDVFQDLRERHKPTGKKLLDEQIEQLKKLFLDKYKKKKLAVEKLFNVPKSKKDILSKEVIKTIELDDNKHNYFKIGQKGIKNIFIASKLETFDKKIMGMFGFILHHVKGVKEGMKDDYINLLKNQKNIKREKFIGELINFTKKYYEHKDVKNILIKGRMPEGFDTLIINKLKELKKSLEQSETIKKKSKKISDLDDKLNLTEGILKRRQEDIKDLEVKNNQQQNLLKIAQKEFKKLKSEQKILNKRNQELRGKNEKVKEALKKKNEEIEVKENELEIKTQGIKLQTNRMIKMRKDFQKLEDEKNKLARGMAEERKERKKLRAMLRQEKEKVKEAKKEVEDINVDRAMKELAIKVLQREKDRFRNEPPKKIEQNIIPKVKDIDKLDKVIKAIRENRSAGTVATLSGFLGITTASIVARIIGNSTANYISPHHKSSTNIVIGDKKDDKQKLIELLLGKRNEDLSELKNDINHLKERLDDDERKKNKRAKKTIMHRHRNKSSINLINVINRI